MFSPNSGEVRYSYDHKQQPQLHQQSHQSQNYSYDAFHSQRPEYRPGIRSPRLKYPQLENPQLQISVIDQRGPRSPSVQQQNYSQPSTRYSYVRGSEANFRGIPEGLERQPGGTVSSPLYAHERARNLQQYSANGSMEHSTPTLPQADSLHQAAPNTVTTTNNDNHTSTPLHPAVPQSPHRAATSPLPFSPTSFQPAPITTPTINPAAAPYSYAPPVEQHPAFAVPIDYRHSQANTYAYKPDETSKRGLSPDAAPPSPGPLPTKSQSALLMAEPTATAASSAPPAVQRANTLPAQSPLPFTPNSPLGPDGGFVTAAFPEPPRTTMQRKEWEHGLCECSGDIGTCCLGVWCPCVLYSRTKYRLRQRSDQRDPTDLLGWKSTDSNSVIFCIACGLQGLLTTLQTLRIRSAYNLRHSLTSAFIEGCCCCCCVLIRDEREVRDRDERARDARRPTAGAGVNNSMQGYRSDQGGMVYAQPP